MMEEKVKEPQPAPQKEKEVVKNLLSVISDPATTPNAIGHITTGQHLLPVPYLPCRNRNSSPKTNRDQLTPAIQDNLHSFLHSRRTLTQNSKAQSKRSQQVKKKKKIKKEKKPCEETTKEEGSNREKKKQTTPNPSAATILPLNNNDGGNGKEKIPISKDQ